MGYSSVGADSQPPTRKVQSWVIQRYEVDQRIWSPRMLLGHLRVPVNHPQRSRGTPRSGPKGIYAALNGLYPNPVDLSLSIPWTNQNIPDLLFSPLLGQTLPAELASYNVAKELVKFNTYKRNLVKEYIPPYTTIECFKRERGCRANFAPCKHLLAFFTHYWKVNMPHLIGCTHQPQRTACSLSPSNIMSLITTVRGLVRELVLP